MSHEHDETSADVTSPLPEGCPVRWLAEDVGRFLADDGADEGTVDRTGRAALGRAADEVDSLLHSAFAAHEVVATELRFAGPRRGFRRTVFALPPTPVALLLLCLRLCDGGDDVTVMQHTAGHGTTTRSEAWPFGMAAAERMTRPPARDTVPLPAGLGLDD